MQVSYECYGEKFGFYLGSATNKSQVPAHSPQHGSGHVNFDVSIRLERK
jgi:hypothetical protein